MFAVSLTAIAALSACSPGPVQPTAGLGANGGCTQTSRSVANPAAPDQTITVYEPGGSAATPLLGGGCSDPKRPVVAVVHGYLAGSSLLYTDEINHLVSIGNIVIFATYNTDTNDFAGSFQRENDALVTAAAATPRADITRFGIVGHSMGGGAVPYLAQQAGNRGWGTDGMFLFLLAPWFTAGVSTGPITLPAQARVVVEGYDNDTWVDNRIGIEIPGHDPQRPAHRPQLAHRPQRRHQVLRPVPHRRRPPVLRPHRPALQRRLLLHGNLARRHPRHAGHLDR